MASFAALGDVIIAEPGALMSFAGPRVVQQTTRERLPDDFGLAESNFRFGQIDMIVPRHELRGTLARMLRLFAGGEFVYAVDEPPATSRRPGCSAVCCIACGAGRTGRPRRTGPVIVRGVRSELRGLRRRIAERAAESDIWDAVELARHDERPYTLDYAERLLDDFTELHGDRAGGEDPAIVAGLGRFRGRTIALVGHQKGRDLKQRAYRNFGSARARGLRKGDPRVRAREPPRFPGR